MRYSTVKVIFRSSDSPYFASNYTLRMQKSLIYSFFDFRFNSNPFTLLRTIYSLNLHNDREEWGNKMETSFTCSKCHDNFSTKDDYRKHILRPHKVKSTRVQFPIKKLKQDSSAKETKNLSKRSSRASSKLPKNYNKLDEHPTSSKKDQRNSKNVPNRRLRNSKNDPKEFQRSSKLEVKTQEK